MRIAKALKLKNRLAGEISRLKGIFQANNSYVEENTPDYDVKNILEEKLLKRVMELVLVKTVIACSNGAIIKPIVIRTCSDSINELSTTAYWDIFMIAELKGLIQMLQCTSTKHGTFSEGYESNTKPVCYISVYGPTDTEALVSEYQSEIDKLQEHLDSHNANVDYSVLDDVKI